MEKQGREMWLGAGFVALVVLLLYFPVHGFGFLSIGDSSVLFENPLVGSGFSMQDLPGVFYVEKGEAWAPLPLLLQALIFQVAGAQAAAFHLISLGVHLFNALLLFLGLALATRSTGKSALAALFFATLPVNAGTVAWVAQLRVLFCAMFCLCGLVLYIQSRASQRTGWPVPVFLCHFLALLCGPEATVFPVMLLFADVWMLPQRHRPVAPGQLIWEKWPFFIMSGMGVVFIAIPYFAWTGSADIWGIFGRSLEYLYACLRKAVLPDDLTALYPGFLHDAPFLEKAALIGFLCSTWLIYLASRKYPAILAGWLWFLGTQVWVPVWFHSPGMFVLADWHVYIPSIGLACAVAWMLPPVHGKIPARSRVVVLVLAVVLVSCVFISRDYLQTWKSDREVFRRNLYYYPENPQALVGLGNWLFANGFFDLAFYRYGQALEADPDYAPAHYNLANALAAQGRIREAEVQYRHAIHARPGYIQALNQLGNLLARTGRPKPAVRYLEAAVRADPGHEVPILNLANVLASLGMLHVSEKYYRAALGLRPAFGEANAGLAAVLVRTGRSDEAMVLLEKNLGMGFDEANTHFSIGDIYLLKNNYARAASHFRMAIAADPGFFQAHNSLGAALLMAGQNQGALENFCKALEINPGYSKARENMDYAQSLLMQDRSFGQ